MKRAIVLSGGGSRGAYQIGVWKALRKLNINYDIVTGTSIGALNGALMTQKDYYGAIKLWNFINYNKILDTKIDGSYDSHRGRREIILKFTKGALEGGLKVGAMEATIDKYLNVNKFFASDIDYGLVTVKFPSMKPTIMKKKDLTKELLKDYLIASAACFPAFKIKNINSESYIDGGYYDNMPINLAIEMGATEVIAVDLNSIGKEKKVSNHNVPVTIIRPRNDIGNFLIIEKKYARRAIELGYNDTLKAFEKLDGYFFTFKKNQLINNYNKYAKDFFDNLFNIINKKKLKSDLIIKIINKTSYKKILSGKNDVSEFNKVVEESGKIFGLDDEVIYSFNFYNHLIKKRFQKLNIQSVDDIKSMIKSKKIKSLFNRRNMVYYIYKEIEKSKGSKLSIYNLAILFPTEFLSAVYIKTLLSR
ncbi:MAG: patatin-like phospholipase family protein [Bacilli bacterium]